ncbi:diacylglycerol O-acyltransferase [Bradyrhizobium sp. GM24.11]
MADGKKLSSLDASFLYLETPEMPMHVGSMAIFRLPDDYKGDFFEDFKAMIVSRLHIAPILKARLEKAPLDIDHPTWVEDDQFDIDRHIFRASLPAPRDRATLERIVGWMHAKLLNRARPLWEFYVFEGMKDNEVGLYSKMHHAAIDGGAGAALTNMIYDISPIPRKVEPPTGGSKPGQEPRDIAANLLDSYQQLFTQPLDASAAAKNLQLPRTGKSDIGSILFDNAMYQIESAVRFAGSIPTMVKSVSDVLGKISDPKSRESLASMVSPPTMLNKSISSERSFAGVSISLSRSKALAKQAGGKLNDVVLALASGVVRRYLQQYGTLPAKSLTAAVPISLREEGNTEANNQVFGMICSIATNIEDPKARLEAIIAQSTKSKEMSHPLRALMPQVSNISMLGAPIIVQIMALLYSRSDLSDVLPPAANITVSNVPGPRQTLYAAGAELLHIFPVSISTHGQALNIHRAELPRPARFRLHRRRQHHSSRASDVRHAAGGVCRARSSLCATRGRHQGRGRIRSLSGFFCNDRNAAAQVRADERNSHGLLRGGPCHRQAAGGVMPWLARTGLLLAPSDQGAE